MLKNLPRYTDNNQARKTQTSGAPLDQVGMRFPDAEGGSDGQSREKGQIG